MIRSIYNNADGQTHTDLSPDDLRAVLKTQKGILWLDIQDESAERCTPLLRDVFAFHPLAIDDALAETHVPKIDDWGDYVYLVLHEVTIGPEDGQAVDTLELDIFMGRNYLVTYQSRPITAVERVWAACQRDERHLERNVSYLLYHVVDELAAGYLPVVETIDELVDEIEDRVVDNPERKLLERIFTLKRSILYLRRIIAPQREVLNKLARGDYGVIDESDRIYFRDVYDHMVRLHDIMEGIRDLVGGALDTYLSVVSNRMNEVMKTLTIITVLFMPLTFLTGFFGMNFFEAISPLPAWTSRVTFYLLLLGMAATPAGMYWWMRRRAWA
ncbi:MAG: magnesium/cobalt transporter CorA [Anaerolineae bacterium]|nr:magnesium/cobalt transporter CorA [Anaerolineae bacterium]